MYNCILLIFFCKPHYTPGMIEEQNTRLNMLIKKYNPRLLEALDLSWPTTLNGATQPAMLK